MDVIWDNSLDTVIACDVLEHVPNDELAISEIFRVLRSGGIAVLTVPQPDGWEVKRELPANASPEQRLQLAGQEDHQRMYGADFPHYLQNAGFVVKQVTHRDFPKSDIDKYVLFPPVLSEKELATNHRTIYFAIKE